MNSLRGASRWMVVLAAAYAFQMPGWGQVIRLPGGVTIGDPRQGNRPSLPGTRPERPDPERVCPRTIEWVGVLQKEYPSVDLSHTQASRVQQMAVPLFADDVFQKEFGVSYLKLSDAERRDFFRMRLIPCTNARQYGQQMTVLQVFNTPFMPGTAGMGPLSPGQLIPALGRLAAARATLRADEQSLASTPPTADTYDHATAISAQRKDELARVWPSEKALFEGIVKDAVARSASLAVEAKIEPLLAGPASTDAARQLSDAPQKYRTLFAAMPPDQQAQLKAKIEARRTTVLRELLPPEQARASSFPATLQGLTDGAIWFPQFQAVFLQSPALPEADAVATAYLSRREAALAHMEAQFRQKIQASQDADTVATLYDDVFRLPEDRRTGTWQELTALRTDRAKFLTARVEQARRAEQEREERAALARGEIVLSSLKLDNLQNKDLFRALYTGEAASAGVSRSNILFTKMFETYLITFGQSCQKALPPNRVRMTYQYCTEHDHYTVYNGWSVSTTDECAHYETRNYDPPAFADPRAYRAEEGASKMAELAFVQDYIRKIFTNPTNIFGGLGSVIVDKETVEQDVPQLIEQNGCGSKALARLQENMTRLALDQDPIHLPGYLPDRSHTTVANELDVRGLADALVRADSTGWAMNHYEGVETAGVVGDLDTEGRPRRVHATYSQKGGLSGEGSVDIQFTDGKPTCLYFADAPASCKVPSPLVLKRYEDGQYRVKNGR